MGGKAGALVMLALWYVLALAIGMFLASIGNPVITWLFVLAAVAFLGPETLKTLRMLRGGADDE